MELLREHEVKALAGFGMFSRGFPGPIQYGPEGTKWDASAVQKWVEEHQSKRKQRRPKGEGDSVETRPVE